MATQIMKCGCVSPQQDKIHGAGNRVVNSTSKTPGFRCTVCGTQKSVGVVDKKAEKAAAAAEKKGKK